MCVYICISIYMHMHLPRIKSNKSILFFFNTYTRIKIIKFTRINSKFIFILPHRMCVCVYFCVCVYTYYPHLPPRAHPHSPTHTHARGACPVCLCVLLLPPQNENTPLHLAAASGHKDVAELLLGHKADVNSVDKVSADGCAEG
jgi:hypothetical protein